MLSDTERADVLEEIAQYPSPRAAAVDALARLQAHRRWIDEEALADLSPLVGVSVHELDALSTFYNRINRRRVGRHLVRYCNSVSCWMLGCDALAAALEQHLGVAPGGTTPDQRFTLLPAVCMGACDRAPVLSVDDELHCEARADEIAGILRGYE